MIKKYVVYEDGYNPSVHNKFVRDTKREAEILAKNINDANVQEFGHGVISVSISIEEIDEE